MSKALVSAAPLKAEVRLAQAVSEFEADLSREQKTEFNASRARAVNEPPSIKDVMQLTAEINRRLSRKVVGGRGIGTRTHSFLQCVQQFTALGDIIIGGSQSLIACGVWSLVRTSLLVGVHSFLSSSVYILTPNSLSSNSLRTLRSFRHFS